MWGGWILPRPPPPPTLKERVYSLSIPWVFTLLAIWPYMRLGMDTFFFILKGMLLKFQVTLL